MDHNAVRLIKAAEGELSFLSLADTVVSYKPQKKYALEKANAFDPTIIHRRAPYYEDTIEISAFVDAAQYVDLREMLVATGLMWVEFDYYHSDNAAWAILQLPVVLAKLPELPDDMREFTAETSFSLVSRYTLPPALIDWDTYTVPDGTEIYV